MTREEMASLKVGDKIRKPYPRWPLCHVVAIVSDGPRDVAMVKSWSKRWQSWRYEAVDDVEMEILYEVTK